MTPTAATGHGFVKGIAQVRNARGVVVGAGFLVASQLLVTCAHVIHQAGYGPGDSVPLVFPGLPETPQTEGTVLAAQWREIEADDVAFLQMEQPPPDAIELALGGAEDCAGHRASSYGFPAQAGPQGHFAHLTAGHLLRGASPAQDLLQLSAANDLTEGFSGAPVIDDVTGLVIGMVTSITPTDAHLRGQNTAYATPTHILRAIHPELVEHAICPYRGLEPFTAEHVDYFHGRDGARNAVIEALRKRRRALLLLGPSGSGKTSLLHAGVLPALAKEAIPASDHWHTVIVPRPGRNLLGALERRGLPGAAVDGIEAAARHRLEGLPPGARLLLVIDQFEELLTPTTQTSLQPPYGDADETRALDQLTHLTRSSLPLTLVLIMRDDFYSTLAAQALGLLEAVCTLLNIPATLTEAELRAIIERPARKAGLHIEKGLADRIISDLRTAPDQGTPVTALPALELTLQQLWDHREDGRLTHRAYERLGTVIGALTTWCTNVFEQLPDELRDIGRRLLTCLVLPADPRSGIPAARLRVPLGTLQDLAASARPASDTHDRIATVLDIFTRHRIITMHSQGQPSGVSVADTADVPVVELIHDSLVLDWYDLHLWVTEDQDFARWLHRAEEQHTRWTKQQHVGSLLHGSDLAAGIEYVNERGLPSHMRHFITISRRRARLRTRTLTVLLTLALIAAGLAAWQWHNATVAQQQALSRQLAAQSDSLTETNPDLAALLAAYAYRTSHTAEATTRLNAVADTSLLHTLRGHSNAVDSMAFSPDAHILATAGNDGAARMWNVGSGRLLHALAGPHGAEVCGVVFNPQGRTLATGSLDGTVQLWDVITGHRLHAFVPSDNSTACSMAFSPDGRSLTAASIDGSAWLWDVGSGRPVHNTLPSAADDVESLALSPNGRILVTGKSFSRGNSDGTVQLWDVASGRLIHALSGHTGNVFRAAFTSNGRTLVTGSDDGTARLWDVTSGRALHTLAHRGKPVWAVAFSPHSQTLATGDEDGTARLWDVASGRLLHTLAGHTTQVGSMAFSPNGRTLAISAARTAQLWDVTTGQPLHTLTGHSQTVDAVTFTPDGRTLATGSDDGTARLWDVAESRYPAVLAGHMGAVYDAQFSPDGRFLATCGADSTARLWDVASGHLVHRFVGHSGDMTFIGFSPDSRTLATAGHNGTVRLWDVTSGQLRTTLTESPAGVASVIFSSNGRLIATVNRDGADRLWDVNSGVLLHTFPDRGVWIAFSPDSRSLATTESDGSTVQIWDIATERRPMTLQGGTAQVWAIAFSANSRTFATGSDDGTARLWDATTGRLQHILTGHTDAVQTLVFSPDNHILATADADATARLWDVTSGHRLHLLTGHTDGLSSVAFSTNGRTLATGSADATARLWDVSTGRLQRILTGHTSAVNKVAFSPDGSILVTASADGTARLWNVVPPDPGEAIAGVCRTVGRDLTMEERAEYLLSASPGRLCSFSRR